MLGFLLCYGERAGRCSREKTISLIMLQCFNELKGQRLHSKRKPPGKIPEPVCSNPSPWKHPDLRSNPTTANKFTLFHLRFALPLLKSFNMHEKGISPYPCKQKLYEHLPKKTPKLIFVFSSNLNYEIRPIY